MSWRLRLHCGAALAAAGALVAAVALGVPPFAAGRAGAQTISTGHGLSGRTIRLPPMLAPTRPAWSAPGNTPADVETFRTVCVRMCDGYYWPISFSTTRGQFFADEAQCRASCDGGARLFFHTNPGGGMADAVDLEGRAYTQLASAFLYRRKQVEACACRPAPWSKAEVARHQQYQREAVEGGEVSPAGAPAADEFADNDGPSLPHPIGSRGIVLPPSRIAPWERHLWYGQASPYRLSGASPYVSVPPGVVPRRNRSPWPSGRSR